MDCSIRGLSRSTHSVNKYALFMFVSSIKRPATFAGIVGTRKLLCGLAIDECKAGNKEIGYRIIKNGEQFTTVPRLLNYRKREWTKKK